MVPKWLALPLVAIVFLLLSPAILLWLAVTGICKLAVLMLIWSTWLPNGIDTLVVYSNSPHWQEYFESTVIPTIGSRAKILNWSQRQEWSRWSLSRLAFHAFTGTRDFNPMILVFRPLRLPQKFPFYRAFRDFKHHNYATLGQLIAELSDALSQPLPMPASDPRTSA
jgi:hypothetical protein